MVQENCDLMSLGVWQPMVRAGLVSTAENGAFYYRSLMDGSLIFRRPIRSNSD